MSKSQLFFESTFTSNSIPYFHYCIAPDSSEARDKLDECWRKMKNDPSTIEHLSIKECNVSRILYWIGRTNREYFSLLGNGDIVEQDYKSPTPYCRIIFREKEAKNYFQYICKCEDNKAAKLMLFGEMPQDKYRVSRCEPLSVFHYNLLKNELNFDDVEKRPFIAPYNDGEDWHYIRVFYLDIDWKYKYYYVRVKNNKQVINKWDYYLHNYANYPLNLQPPVETKAATKMPESDFDALMRRMPNLDWDLGGIEEEAELIREREKKLDSMI